MKYASVCKVFYGISIFDGVGYFLWFGSYLRGASTFAITAYLSGN